MSDLVDFLLARIADDAGIAESVAPAPWSTAQGDDDDVQVISHQHGELVAISNLLDAEHIARHDPARVLADCAAKRRIVEACGEWWDPNDRRWLSCDGYHGGIQAAMEWLALPYADHPDFREEWRP